MVSSLIAAKAYATAQSATKLGSLGAAMPLAQEGSGFGALVQNAINETINSGRNAEQQIKAQVQGKADLIDVVTAISSAETSLETIMAVRDQAISAYQEIMRMPI
jgi:flagellar hook-basal body complex protein FliE